MPIKTFAEMNAPSLKMGFRGEFFFLSNFYPHAFSWKGRMWDTAEHAYQASKAEPHSALYYEIANAKTPAIAKRLGRRARLPANWERRKVAFMLDIVRTKFADQKLAQMLLATGDMELVEENYWKDYFWGRCNGEGKNMLGRILMHVREELRQNGGKTLLNFEP